MLLADNSSESEEDESFVLGILNHFKLAMSSRIPDPRIPDRLIHQYAEILRRASMLYRYDVRAEGGTTAPVINEASEDTRYWAFDLLMASVAARRKAESTRRDVAKDGAEWRRVAKLVLPAVVRRIDEALKRFVDDAKLRGQMPLGRARDDELLYILRHLATMTMYEGTMASAGNVPVVLEGAYRTSPRAHLFHFYPLLLQISFLRGCIPSMWIFPSEHARLFASIPVDADEDGVREGEKAESPDGGEGAMDGNGVNAGDGGDLIEVSARDLARRCLELIGEEMGLN